jgi:hypothetical protein
MHGTIWTVAGSQWDDSDTLVGAFPPAHTGAAAVCLKWEASIKNGVLSMVQDERNWRYASPVLLTLVNDFVMARCTDLFGDTTLIGRMTVNRKPIEKTGEVRGSRGYSQEKLHVLHSE